MVECSRRSSGQLLLTGFQIANMLLLDKAQKSFKQVKGAKGDEDVVDKDVRSNCTSPTSLALRRRRRS